MYRVTTFTALAGTRACVNDCPICISKMTPSMGMEDEVSINIEKFKRAIQIAKNYNTENLLITGKGEPTLYPNQILNYLNMANDYGNFDRIELQTEGSHLLSLVLSEIKKSGHSDGWTWLNSWKDAGLDLIAISIYHWNLPKNAEGFGVKKTYDLNTLIEKLHEAGLMVRLSCVMMKGFIDNRNEVNNLIQFCKEMKVEQLTLRELGLPPHPVKGEVSVSAQEAVQSMRFDTRVIKKMIERKGVLCRKLPYGAKIYEIDGQNVGVTTGLGSEDDTIIRGLIFFPEGILTTSWEYVNGGRIL